MAYNQRHNYHPAITICNKRLTYPPDFLPDYLKGLSRDIAGSKDPNAYFLRGSFYINQAEFPKAIDDFSAVLEQDPQNLLAIFNLANARMFMYDYIESVDDKTPKVVGVQTAEHRTVDYTLVLEGYRKCLELDPDFVFALFNMANVYTKSREIDKAIETYTQVIRMDKDLAEAYFNRGLLYVYTGQKALANADLSKAGELGIINAYNVIKRYCKDNTE